MKKLSRCILLILCLIIGLSACKEKAQTLEPYLSELRSSSFYGQSQNYQVKQVTALRRFHRTTTAKF